MLSTITKTNSGPTTTILIAQQKKFIREATQENIITWFKENYTTEEDKNSYSRTNGFKPELFINFLEKGEKYVTARFAIFKSMASKILGWEIKSKDYVRFLYDYHIALTWEDIRKRIMEEAKQVQRKVIVLIDGDNLSNDLNLYELIEYYEKKKNLLHVVIVFANGIVNDAIMSHETKDGISIMHSLTNTKDAADTCISLLIGSLHATLHAFFPVAKHSFIVVTKDHFFEELSKQFQLVGRQCFPAKSIKECINILGRIDGNDTIEITISEQKVTNSKKTGIAAIKIVEKPTSQDLKELFNVAWLGLGKSQNQFCKTNNLDSTNFSKHINGKKYNHACKLRLEEFYKAFKTSSTEVSHFVVNIRGHTKELDIYHTYYGENGEEIEFEINPNEFSFTTPHDYNPLIKDSYPVMYEEWMSEDGKYFAEFLKWVGDSKIVRAKLRGSILTIPLKMYDPTDPSDDKAFPIDIEIRMEKDKPVKLNLVAPIGQVNSTIHTYFAFNYWTPQEVIAQNNEVCSEVTGDLFHPDQSIRIRIYNFSSTFKPFTGPSIEASRQVFYPEHEIDLGKYQEAQDLISERCVFYKINEEFVLSTRRSLKNGSENRMILKQTVVDYILKRDSSCEQVDGIIDSVEENPKLDIYYIGCKVL